MKEEILNEFKQTTDDLIRSITSFSAEELNIIPFEKSWTAGQVGDHLLKSYAIVEILNGPVQQTERPADEKIEQFKTMFLNFEDKKNAPKSVIPTANAIDKEKLLTALKDKISEISHIVETEDLTATCVRFAIPEYGTFTRLEWIYHTIYHTQRHLHQLKNIALIVKEKNLNLV